MLPKSEAWKKRQAEKPLLRGLWEFIEEKRFKFYVKEGKTYTMRTGVPGVWEEVARGIKERTDREKEATEAAGKATPKGVKPRRVGITLPSAPRKEPQHPAFPVLKRQTARRPSE